MRIIKVKIHKAFGFANIEISHLFRAVIQSAKEVSMEFEARASI